MHQPIGRFEVGPGLAVLLETGDRYSNPRVGFGHADPGAGLRLQVEPQVQSLRRADELDRDDALELLRAARANGWSAFRMLHDEERLLFEPLEGMAEYEAKTAGRLLAIPHNGNLSNGLMFPPRTSYGTEITREWAERSQANTVAVEIAQTKGASETIPALSCPRCCSA